MTIFKCLKYACADSWVNVAFTSMRFTAQSTPIKRSIDSLYAFVSIHTHDLVKFVKGQICPCVQLEFFGLIQFVESVCLNWFNFAITNGQIFLLGASLVVIKLFVRQNKDKTMLAFSPSLSLSLSLFDDCHHRHWLSIAFDIWLWAMVLSISPNKTILVHAVRCLFLLT